MNLDSEIIQKLEYVLKKRNFLAHRFFRESIYEQSSPEGRYRVINKLIEIENEVLLVDKILSPVSKLLTNQVIDYDLLIDKHIKEIKTGIVDPITKVAISEFYY